MKIEGSSGQGSVEPKKEFKRPNQEHVRIGDESESSAETNNSETRRTDSKVSVEA